MNCAIAVEGPGAPRRVPAVDLTVGEHGTARVALPGSFRPGLHRVTVDAGPLGRATTGFWVFDAALFASGGALTFDGYTLRRDGHPEPIVGTTTMSATVHRDFLFEPNAAAWDDGFGEIAALKLNAIRTGLWSGWRRITVDANVVDEGVLRALEAFYLTARTHGLPVIFTLFAFVPEDFGAGDPYFAQRALEGQRAFVSALARRMAPAREFIWDLINEPSFASPRDLWSLRPVRTPEERRAFRDWLAVRYQPPDGAPGAWQEVVRRRWRLLAGEAIDLPADDDFTDVWVMGTRRPYRALDYALFAQDRFERWIGDMRAAIRQGGSGGAITVGQDEAGLATSPAPLFHHAAVDFTSMHTWWNSDALLWDGLVAKGTGTPLLVSETGIMQRQHLSGEAVRSPDDFAAILSRKIGYAFASGAFGVIQWCYETNPFINSDNEAAIGLKRADGSVKPEHGVLAQAAAFVARNRARFDGYVAPEIAVVVPTAELLSPRSLAAMLRACHGAGALRDARPAAARGRRPPRGPRSGSAAGHRPSGLPLGVRRGLAGHRGRRPGGHHPDLFRLVRDRRCGTSGGTAWRGVTAAADDRGIARPGRGAGQRVPVPRVRSRSRGVPPQRPVPDASRMGPAPSSTIRCRSSGPSPRRRCRSSTGPR